MIESKDLSCWAQCSCGWRGVTHRGDADSAHDAALADRAAHVAGALEPIPPAPGVPATTTPDLFTT